MHVYNTSIQVPPPPPLGCLLILLEKNDFCKLKYLYSHQDLHDLIFEKQFSESIYNQGKIQTVNIWLCCTKYVISVIPFST